MRSAETWWGGPSREPAHTVTHQVKAAKKNGVIRVTLVSFLQHNSRVQSHGNVEWTRDIAIAARVGAASRIHNRVAISQGVARAATGFLIGFNFGMGAFPNLIPE